MMEERFAEWGEVIRLGARTRAPHRHPLLKVFVTSQPHVSPAASAAPQLAQGLAVLPFPQQLWRAFDPPTSSLRLNYRQPRFIEHPLSEATDSRPQRPLVPVLLLTALSSFTAWYVYRVTGQKLQLQAQVRTYAEVLSQERQVKATLLSPYVKIITLQGHATDGISAKIFWDTMSHNCLMYLSGLPQTAPDEYFQLWFYTADEKFVKAKEFQATEGAAEIHLQLPSLDVAEVERVVVSRETAGEHSFPEGPILLKGAWR